MKGRSRETRRAVVVAEADGKIASVAADTIVLTRSGEMPEGKKKIKHDPDSGVYVYELRKFLRSKCRNLC